MTSIGVAVLCGAYVLGLLLTGISGQLPGVLAPIPIGAIALLGAGILLSVTAPRVWRTGPSARTWLASALVGIVAIAYFQWRLPEPSAHDISRLLSDANPPVEAQVVDVWGQIDTIPHLTRSQRIQFELEVDGVKPLDASGTIVSAKTDGKIYVTVPLLQGNGLHPGQLVTVSGKLYLPKAANNPGGFDFQAYLRQQGIFAGLNGTTVTPSATREFLSPIDALNKRLWLLRRRIVQAQVAGLGIPEGPLLSAMVMGRLGVDLDFSLQDQFAQVGLAHALAASGFHVSLLLVCVLAIASRCSAVAKLGIGITTLIGFVSLAGAQPSVLRAAFMGFAALIAMTVERKLKSVELLLATATLLLVQNPLWIWNLGFQFSFLATLGLLVTAPVLTRWLDWLPVAIAPFIAVPIAAYLWTLPLQLATFGVVSPFTIPVNLIATPLITVVSLGGFLSAFAAALYPPIGSAIAWTLHYPTYELIQLAQFGSHLPGSALAIGRLAPWQVVALYSGMGLLWWQSRWHRHWWLAGLMGLSVIAIPIGYSSTTLSQVTLLATPQTPIMVVQHHGSVGLLNSGSDNDQTYTVLPFLRQQGINQIDWAIAPTFDSTQAEGWFKLAQALPIRQFYYGAIAAEASSPQSFPLHQQVLKQLQQRGTLVQPLSSGQPLRENGVSLSATPSLLQFQIAQTHWAIQWSTGPTVPPASLPQTDVFWWPGSDLSEPTWQILKPQVAIASHAVSEQTRSHLEMNGTTVYSVDEAAVQWSTQKGFQAIASDPTWQ